MGATPNYGWPIPEYGESTDVPADLTQLGTAIDATVKGVETLVGTHTHPYLPLAGGNVSGPVSGVAPTQAAHLTRKDYVDSLSASAAKITYGTGDPPASGMKAGDLHFKYN
jgi:hypothetical protein